MRFRDQLRALRHTFGSHPERLALTLLGIVIGTGSIVLLASLLHGGKDALLRSNQFATDSDIVNVDSDPAPLEEQSKPTRALSARDGQTIAGSALLPGARVSAERIKLGAEARHDRQHKLVTLVGADPGALALHRLTLARGRFIDADDVAQRRRVCVVGANVAGELLGPAALDEAVIDVAGATCSVVGVLTPKPSFGGVAGPMLWNNKVLLPESTFDALFSGDHHVDQLYVKILGVGPLDARLTRGRLDIGAIVLRNHLGVHNFKVDRWASAKQQEQLIVAVVEMLIIATALLSLMVGGINIMNIMLVTVTERTREIGVRRAVGASAHAIRLQFLLEAAVLSTTGGVIGIAGGVGVAALTATLLARLVGDWQLIIVPWSVALGLTLSLLTGLVFGILPAWRASQLDPIEALRAR